MNAMIELAARSGYQELSIAQLSSHAGVSSSTFYAQFNSKEDCLLAAYRAASEQILGGVQPLGDRGWSETANSALTGLVRALQANAAAGRLLLIEARAAGPRLRAQRERALGAFELQAEEFLDGRRKGEETLDIPATALVGGIRSVITRHMRMHTEDRMPSSTQDMLTWMGSYAIRATRARWSTGPHALLPASAVQRRSPVANAPARLPRGRHRLPASVVTRSRRMRLIDGIAEVMMAKGYADATVADIVAAAGVARDVFYEHFTDKQHAFLEAQQHPTQHILDACAAAYFAAEDWPQRMWNMLQTLTNLIVENPAISHLRLVECYAAGGAAIRRAEEITRSFTIFFEEGYGYRAEPDRLPRLCSQAIAGAIFEIIQRHAARGDYAALGRKLPQLVYVAIAPFTGPEEAIRLLEEMGAAAQDSRTDSAQRRVT